MLPDGSDPGTKNHCNCAAEPRILLFPSYRSQTYSNSLSRTTSGESSPSKVRMIWIGSVDSVLLEWDGLEELKSH